MQDSPVTPGSLTLRYASSQADVRHLHSGTIALLSPLFRRRGQSPAAIEDVHQELQFFKRILRKHVLRASVVKMEATRLRRRFDEALQAIGVPYAGEHFLPLRSTWRRDLLPVRESTTSTYFIQSRRWCRNRYEKIKESSRNPRTVSTRPRRGTPCPLARISFVASAPARTAQPAHGAPGGVRSVRPCPYRRQQFVGSPDDSHNL